MVVILPKRGIAVKVRDRPPLRIGGLFYNETMIVAHVRHADGTSDVYNSLIEAARALREAEAQIWLDIEEPDEWTLALLGEAFSLHPLAIEDCLHGEQRPHIDPYDGYIFMVVHAPILSEDKEFLATRSWPCSLRRCL